ncbi:MAG: Flp pilus assembly complex ATPase component TadA [Pirellula sp.]|jgi:type II secretory ATPase GspE/PulE/Tfp pilus assembly ATPase PilB-like protein|nr:Flp pilus assembly complex ATPase component TadA [Pirellula sp.]
MVFGRKKKKEADQGAAVVGGDAPLPALEIKPIGINKDEATGLIIACKQLPGYPIALVLIANAISGRADRILIDYSAQGAVVRYRLDGMWETLPAMDRASADAALVVYKKILGLNPAERRARQDGKFATNFKDIDWVVSFTSMGVPSGERVLFSIDRKKPLLKTLGDLGMRDGMQEQFKAMMNGHEGLIIISAPATHGLPTTWRIALENADKFVRDWVSIENKKDADPEIINVTQYFYEDGTADTPEAVFEKVRLKQPDVFVLPSLINGDIVESVLNQINTEHKHAVTRVVANDAFDAVIQVLSAYPNHAKSLIKVMQGVLNQRLIRRLCDNCKQPYQPTPQLLQKLGIPAGRVPKLYNPTVPPPPEQRVDAKGNPVEFEICKRCNGRGYLGRMAIFELLTIDDTMRQAIAKLASKPDELRKFAKSRNHLSFQEEGILACALGVTSLQEIQRLMSGK